MGLYRRFGCPKEMSIEISGKLGFFVTRQDVYHSLHDNCLSKKIKSPVPGMAIEIERQMFVQQLKALWTKGDQVSQYFHYCHG